MYQTLANGGFKLSQKALVVPQPLTGDTQLALIDPLLLIIAAVALQLAKLALRLAQLLLAAP